MILSSSGVGIIAQYLVPIGTQLLKFTWYLVPSGTQLLKFAWYLVPSGTQLLQCSRFAQFFVQPAANGLNENSDAFQSICSIFRSQVNKMALNFRWINQDNFQLLSVIFLSGLAKLLRRRLWLIWARIWLLILQVQHSYVIFFSFKFVWLQSLSVSWRAEIFWFH